MIMTFRLFRCDVTISVPFAAMLAALLYFDRTGLFPLALAVVLIHETGHIAACRMLHQLPSRIVLRPGAVQIFTPPSVLPPLWDVVIALAGPLLNLAAGAVAALVYAFCYQHVNLLVFIAGNLAAALFNLMPVQGLDGGRVLELILYAQMGENAVRVLKWISFFFILLLLAAGLWVFIHSLGNPTLLIAALYLAALWLMGIKSKN